MSATPVWLRDAVFYEIYPQSFRDTNADGVGDLGGVLESLDYLQWLGVTAIWFNPCFVSPFHDAGYDVSDYLTVAPRYGTNEDMVRVFDEARRRGIRVVLDLVAGHTSDEHPLFVAELQRAGRGEGEEEQYIWADPDQVADPSRLDEDMVVSPGPRPGWYRRNFYDSQPALNFGYARPHPDEPWRQPVDAEGPRRNRRMLAEIMDHWLDLGASGFRVDMPFSLVKDDDPVRYPESTRLWRELREHLDSRHPDAVILPEGFERRGPAGLPPSFHGDFFLVIADEHYRMFANRGAGDIPWLEPQPCFFASAGEGSTDVFLDGWARHKAAFGADRPILLTSADHDYSRLSSGERVGEQLHPAWVFLMTWESVPGIYYGDEIGMRYLPGLGDVEGSRWDPSYNRAGCRTPMQWDATANAGFSSAPADRLYLPVDPDPGRPTVAAQREDPGSLLCFVRDLVTLRRSHPALAMTSGTEVVHPGYPLTYVRGTQADGPRLLVTVNPSATARRLDLPAGVAVAEGVDPLLARDVEIAGSALQVRPMGYAVMELR